MFPAWVIEPVDVFEDGDFSGPWCLRGPSCLAGVPPDQRGLDGREESFHHRIVITITLGAH